MIATAKQILKPLNLKPPKKKKKKIGVGLDGHGPFSLYANAQSSAPWLGPADGHQRTHR